ncbi:hypothetical protein FB451DRAFT_1557253 [Mycena latifolia]|nr:hypothetical protein FB451DRAFT_1557253 [Mycena latifolia]
MAIFGIRVATYELKPEISVQGVADKVASVSRATSRAHGEFRRGVRHHAHGSRLPDGGLRAARHHRPWHRGADAQPGYGAPHTAHTCNPVPFILAGAASEGYGLVPENSRADDEEEGAQCDVAPRLTLLDPEPAYHYWGSRYLRNRSLIPKKK